MNNRDKEILGHMSVSTLPSKPKRAIAKFRMAFAVGGVILVCAAGIVVAQEARRPSASTQPAHTPQPRLESPARSGGAAVNPERRDGNLRLPGMNLGGNAAQANNITKAERDEVMAFVKENMPETSKFLDESERQASQPGMRQRRGWIFAHALSQYRRYTKSKTDFPDFEEKYIEEVKVTDEILGLAIQHTRSKNTDEKSDLRQKMRGKLIWLAQSALDERRRRVEKLRLALSREEENLSRDEQRIDEGVNVRLEEMINRITYGTRNPPPEMMTTQPSGN